MRKFLQKRGTLSLMGSLVSILAGLLLGFILLLIFNPAHAIGGLEDMLLSGARDMSKLGKVLYTAAPLLMTGLSVGFAFKTGLFNIGASGQYTVGAFFALTVGIQFQLPWYVAILAGMIGGAIWGAIPGIFKAYFNINEVISAIMFNWIGLFAVNMCINNMPMMLANASGQVARDRTARLADGQPRGGVGPSSGLDSVFGNYMNIGIFIAVIFAVIAWVILSKTTFGYELKACGYNRNASLYAGIKDKRNIVLSMAIAGAFAGVGGAIYYLSGTAQFTIIKTLVNMGFNGIPVALLASSHPIGTIFSSLFISYIQVGGESLQPEFAKEIIDIIIAAIIYLSAFALLVQGGIAHLLSRKHERAAGKEED
mgnify:CR=1 FL=1